MNAKDYFKEWYNTKWLGKGHKHSCEKKHNSILQDYYSKKYETNLIHSMTSRDFLDGIKKRNLEKMKAEFASRGPKESEEDKVVRILKKDFEAKHGMTFDRFIEVYNDVLKNNPEKLI